MAQQAQEHEMLQERPVGRALGRLGGWVLLTLGVALLGVIGTRLWTTATQRETLGALLRDAPTHFLAVMGGQHGQAEASAGAGGGHDTPHFAQYLCAAPVAQTIRADDVAVSLQLDAATIGERVVNLQLRDANDVPVTAERVTLHFVARDMRMPSYTTQAQATGAGSFQAQGDFFAMPGRWEATASIQRPASPSLRVPFQLTIVNPAAPDADAPLPPLIFVRDHQLWRSDGTAAAPEQLTSLPREERAFYPALSPDGTQLAFVGRIPGQSTLYTMRPDGSALRPLWTPPQGTLEMAVWSPDQTAIYVGVEFLPPPKVVGGPQFHQIMRVDATTGSVTPLLSNAYHPTIASDGSGMAYVSYTDEGVQLNTASLDGSDITNVLNGAQFDDLYAPRFAPDDMQLVFSASGGPTTDVDGFPLARDAWDREEATNGHGHRSGWELWSIKRDGTGLRRLTSLLADMPLAAWAPNGTQLVVLSNTGIYLLDANGANARRIDQQPAGLGVVWLPTKAERERP